MRPSWKPLACLVLSVALASAQEAGPDKAGIGRIESYLRNCSHFGWSGAALVAHKGELILAQGYGAADRESGRLNDVETLFEIASATKPFTACAILKLEELGKLSIEDSIGEHLPGVPRDKRDITIAHLLSHASGMPRSAVGGGGAVLEEAVRGYLRSPRQRESGKACEYWNGGYALLAGIVEAATEQSYTDFCREHLFEPAGMSSTGFTGDEALPLDRQAIGYGEGQPLRHAAGHPYGSYGYQYRGMGGVVTSALDLWRFAQALDAGRILKPETLARMQTPVIESQGLGWGITRTDRGTTRISHGGDVAGFHTQFQRYPDEDVVLIVLSNVDEVSVWPLAWNMEGLLFGGKAKYAMPPKADELTDRELDALVGEYSLPEGDGRLVVEKAGRGLRIGVRGQAAITRLASAAPPAPRARPFPDTVEMESGLEEEIALAVEVVAAVVRKDADWIRARLMDRIPGSWPDLLVNHIWSQHVDALGPHVASNVLSATRLGTEAAQIILMLEHEAGERRLQIVLRSGKLNIFGLEPRAQESKPSASFDEDVALARRLLTAVTSKDADFIRSTLLEHIPASWPDRLVSQYWPEHVERSGELQEVSLIGATRLAEGRVEVLLGLSHTEHERGLRVIFQDGRLNIFDLNGPLALSEKLYFPTSPTEFTSFDWKPPFRASHVRFAIGEDEVRAVCAGPTGRVVTFVR